MDSEIQSQGEAQRDGAVRSMKCSAADPRVGKLTPEDAAMLKKLAEDIGALDCMPAWMRAEIEAKTKPPNGPDQRPGGKQPES